MRLLIDYIWFLIKSTNQYGVHSPFVYQFLTKGLYQKADNIVINQYKTYRKNLLNNKNYLTIKEFGAGSKHFKTNQRSIAKMAKWSGITPEKAKIFHQILAYFNPKNILEFGTHLGLSTGIIANTLPNSNLTTIEGCKATFEFVNQLKALKNVSHINQTFDEFLASNTKLFDLVFIDGNHQKQATIAYVEYWLKNITNDGIIVLDDIYWHQDMKDAWQNIITNKRVTVSIDLFYFGLLFIRKEQTKQHFIIRPKAYYVV